MNSLATAYYKTGDLAKAQEEYKGITSLTSGRMICVDIYTKFLDLWKDADPGIPEIAETKKKLSALQ